MSWFLVSSLLKLSLSLPRSNKIGGLVMLKQRLVWKTTRTYRNNGTTAPYDDNTYPELEYYDDGTPSNSQGGLLELLFAGIFVTIIMPILSGVYLWYVGVLVHPKPASSETWSTLASSSNFFYNYAAYIAAVSLKFIVWDIPVFFYEIVYSVMNYAFAMKTEIGKLGAQIGSLFITLGAIAYFCGFAGMVSLYGAFYMVTERTKLTICLLGTLLFAFLIFPGLAGLCGWFGVLVYRSL
ncbi:hypothetical protein M2352_003693 [Azospirillum fermentarium]|uniref:hypothetical protein n=1 Tax=Azospirillum fermentarium TaxID=1233114 RepID=UPI002227DEDA|nr:hypothetical protein [Azospirillum fermentarium]MCW2248059.1 hypothetical protein [Azospirillum fermentarium]